MTIYHRTWVETDAARLTHNFHAIQHAVGPETEVLAVIKADAYGHSAELCAPILARAGARFLGVTDPAEGTRVRHALAKDGTADQDQLQILIMCGSLPEDTAALDAANLTPVVWTPAHIQAFAHLKHIKLHIEIDTGMGRQGARPGPELAALLEALHASNLQLEGLFTHLSCSEAPGSATTALQKQRFEAAVAQVRKSCMQPKWLHIANSSAVDHPADTRDWLATLARSVGARPMVRTGLALYGYTLPTDDTAPPRQTDPPQLAPHLQPVLAWHARILSTHTLASGDTVGYGATFTAPRPMRVALLPIGYADGLRRELSNPTPHTPQAPNTAEAPNTAVILEHRSRISVLPAATEPSQHTIEGSNAPEASHPAPTAPAHTVDGIPCPILGRISMNLTVIDITAAPHLTPGDTVTLLGPHFTAEDHARLAGTIPYEILCALRPLPHVLT